MIPLPAVLGPTGSGKSELAIRIARAVGGEVVNCDSLQVFRGFNVGTAKLSQREWQGVPHHLIDILEPGQLFTAGDYARSAGAALRDIAARGRIPVLAGGSGFYLRALLEGLSPAPTRDEDLRARLRTREEQRPGSLHRILTRLDEPAAARIHPNDKNKTMRALEVQLLRHRDRAAIVEESAPRMLPGYVPIKIGLSPARDLLYARLNARARRMFEEGLIDEVRQLLDAGVPRTAKPFESLGYKQALQVIDGTVTVEQAIELTQLQTRRYAKRQWTWFRKERGVHWLRGLGGDALIQSQAIEIVREHGPLCIF